MYRHFLCSENIFDLKSASLLFSKSNRQNMGKS